MRAKIFEKVAQNSLRQQTIMHSALKEEKDTLVANYEKTVNRLKQRIEENKNIVKQNTENEVKSKEFTKMKQDLEVWKKKALKYRKCL